MAFKQWAKLFAVVVPLVLAVRYLVLNEPGQFARFNEISRGYIAYILIAFTGLSLVGLCFMLSRKLAPARQERIIKLYTWGSSIFLGTVMAAAVIYVKLST